MKNNIQLPTNSAKNSSNLQELQRRNIPYLFGYTPTYLVPHKIPLRMKTEKNASADKNKKIKKKKKEKKEKTVQYTKIIIQELIWCKRSRKHLRYSVVSFNI